MARNTLIVVSLSLVVLFTVLYFKAKDTVTVAQIQARSTRVNPSAAPAQRAIGIAQPQSLPPTTGMTSNTVAIRRDLQKEIQTLQAQVAERRRLLQERSARLSELRTQAQSRNPATDTNDPPRSSEPPPAEQLENHTEELRALSADLNEMRESREASRLAEDDAIAIRENANQLALSQVEAEILRMEEAKARTQAEYERWARSNTLKTGQLPTNPETEKTIADQQAQIETLRQQKLALTESWHAEATSIYTLGYQVRDQLRSEEQNVRSQIFSLQNEIRRLQKSEVQGRQAQQSQSTQLQQAQRALQAETEQLRRLESDLATKQTELRRLE